MHEFVNYWNKLKYCEVARFKYNRQWLFVSRKSILGCVLCTRLYIPLKCALIRVDAKLLNIMVWRVLLQARIVLSRAQQQQWHVVCIRYGKQLRIKHYGKDTPNYTYYMQRYVRCHESIQKAC